MLGLGLSLAKAYTSEAQKDSHKRIHGGHKCSFCGKSFDKPSLLSKHLVTSHDQQSSMVSKQPVMCKICNDRFSSTKLLGMHMQRLHKEVALKCDMCDKHLFTMKALKHHKRSHKSKKPVDDNPDDGIEEANEGNNNTISEASTNVRVLMTVQDNENYEVMNNIFIVEVPENSEENVHIHKSDQNRKSSDVVINFEDY